MHAQKATVSAVLDAGHDYCIGVKGNQKKLAQRIKKHIETKKCRSIDISMEKNKGRFEIRSVSVYGAFYGARKDWAGFRSIIVVDRIRRSSSSDWYGKKKVFDETREVSYYISSLKPTAGAAKFAECIRSHWAIENSLHWVKDVTLGEDASRIRSGNAPENMSLLRNIALNIFRKNGYTNIAQAIRMMSHEIPLLWGELGG